MEEPIVKRSWRRNWAVLSAILIHFTWGILLLISSAPLTTTPMAEFPIQNQYAAAATYLAVAFLAAVPWVWTRIDDHFAALVLCLPQQFLLMLSAWEGIVSGLRGTYPDGYAPEGGAIFIWADQCPIIIFMVLHTFSLVDWFWWSRRY